jgi:hypothetical protein
MVFDEEKLHHSIRKQIPTRNSQTIVRRFARCRLAEPEPPQDD